MAQIWHCCWLWCRPAAIALIQSLAREPPYAVGVAPPPKKQDSLLTSSGPPSLCLLPPSRGLLHSSRLLQTLHLPLHGGNRSNGLCAYMLPGQGGAPLPFPLWPGMGLEPPIVSETSQLPQVAPSSPGPPGPKDLGSISLCDFLMVIHFTSSQRGEGQVRCSPSSEVETGDNDTLSAASGPPAPAPPPNGV